MPFLFQEFSLRRPYFSNLLFQGFFRWEITSEKLFKVGPDLPEFIQNRVESEENIERLVSNTFFNLNIYFSIPNEKKIAF